MNAPSASTIFGVAGPQKMRLNYPPWYGFTMRDSATVSGNGSASESPAHLVPAEPARAAATVAHLDPNALALPALVWRMSDGACVAANEALQDLLALPRDAIVGRAFTELVHAADQPGSSSGMHEVLLCGGRGRQLPLAMLALPARHAGQAVHMCLFFESRTQASRSGDLTAAIDTVLREEMAWFAGAVLEHLARIRAPTLRQTGLAGLTPRERQVLKLICQGCSDSDIARQLGISRNTVRNHVSNIYGKANVKRRSEAVVWGRERGVSSM